MCKGIEEGSNGVRFRGPEVAVVTTRSNVSCELCDSRASIYCHSDNAYLCGKCDKWVHGANFLAQRHARCLLCDTCQCLTGRYLVRASSESAGRSWCDPKANKKQLNGRERTKIS